MLRQLILCSISIACLSLGGCATMNEDFSCNKTAGDSCLTMDQVNAMTETRYMPNKNSQLKNKVYSQVSDYEHIWLASDEKGAPNV